MSANPWELVLQRLRTELDSEEYRRWFGTTAYAGDSGDQISVWVPTEADRRHLTRSYADVIGRALEDTGRTNVHIRFIVSGIGDEDEDEAS